MNQTSDWIPLDRNAFPQKFFEFSRAAKLWDNQVGCARFREKHKSVIEAYSKGGSETWPPNPSFQNFSKSDCIQMRLRHVTVWVKRPDFLKPNWMEGLRFCSRCGLSCDFTWNRFMDEEVDVELHVSSDPNVSHQSSISFEPERKRFKNEPLIAKLDIEPHDWWDTPSNFDIRISYGPQYDLQITYARTKERQRLLAPKKIQDVVIYCALSNCEVEFRNQMSREILSHFRHHSFGLCDNNMGDLNRELLLYPHCENNFPRSKQRFEWTKFANCIMSHYKFSLAIEKTVKMGYVSEKLFMPLQSRSVPIYFGAPDVENYMPPHSFIHVRDFKTLDELVDYVKKVHNDPVLYMEYFAWRRCGVPGNYARVRELSMDTLPCRLCELASARGGRRAPAHQGGRTAPPRAKSGESGTEK